MIGLHDIFAMIYGASAILFILRMEDIDIRTVDAKYFGIVALVFVVLFVIT